MLSPERISELKAEHGHLLTHTIEGVTYVSRMPTLEELTGWAAAAPGEATARKLVALMNCVLEPAGEELAKIRREIAGLATVIPIRLLVSSGAIDAVLEAEESLMSQEQAKALVEQEKVGMGKVHPIAFRRGSFVYEAVVRDFTERELSAYLREYQAGDFNAMKERTRVVTVWGDSAVLERRAPGLYLSILQFLSGKAHLSAKVEEGEL